MLRYFKTVVVILKCMHNNNNNNNDNNNNKSLGVCLSQNRFYEELNE